MSIITTRLIGSGQFTDGYLIARPLNPWVLWDGEATKPITKRFKIVEKMLYELDGTTTATIVPSYVASGFVPTATEFPVIMYPDNNSYYVEIVQRGYRVLDGYWQIPYDPADNGAEWFDIQLTDDTVTYPTYRANTDPIKTYTNSGVMWADFDNVLEGTVTYTTDTGLYWGRGELTFLPFQGLPRKSLMLRDYAPGLTSTGQILYDRTNTENGMLGLVDTVDTNDPAWNPTNRALLYGADDFVRAGGLPWD